MQFRNPFTLGKRREDLATSPYTGELVHLLAARFGTTPGEQGAYIGAASTRLARLFLEHGHTLTATASHLEGRAELERLQQRWPGFRVVDGTPYRTHLASASCDFILSERVLHLPDLDAVREEFCRILRPGGAVMLITDNRVYAGSAQAEAFEDLLRSHCANFREKAAPSDIQGKLAHFFGESDFFEDAFIGLQMLSFEALLHQTSSLPIYPAAGDPGEPAIREALADFFERWATNGKLSVPIVCRVACGRLARSASGLYAMERQLTLTH